MAAIGAPIKFELAPPPFACAVPVVVEVVAALELVGFLFTCASASAEFVFELSALAIIRLYFF